MTAVLDTADRALDVGVRGVVQGVGFRPFVHRLAERHRIRGRVRNEAGRVWLHIEGTDLALDRFLRDLRTNAPPLARIDDMDVADTAIRRYADFRIAVSRDRIDQRLPVSPDACICDACAAELFQPASRRYRHPFITCTDCGPRYTVIEAMPYDRERTTMRRFPMCPDCRREYGDPTNRRYHSETNSCPRCGPTVRLLTAAGAPIASEDPVAGAARRLAAGKIVAVRGLGGFHLAADARNPWAVATLRQRKHRDAKPLAVMVARLEDALRLVHLTAREREVLLSPQRPIVVARARDGHGLAEEVSPGLAWLGIMLAYTPLHHLLLERSERPLVMTSGNATDEPIAIKNEEAMARLASVADAFLVHDREIVARYDDSVVRVVDEAPVFLRRARGYAPLPVALPRATPVQLVAVGPHLKNTFTLAHGGSAFVSQHIGDLDNLETLAHFRTTLDAYQRLFRITPRVAVCDRHPGYLSTRVAGELGLERVIEVQHHHAHVAAVAAEHGIADPVLGIAYDGTGYGDDGHVWGAEMLVADLTGYRRVAQLRYAPLPGGDLAARQPWRAALGYLSLDPERRDAFRIAFERVPRADREIAERQVARRLNAPLASSMGRLFDAAAAVIGARRWSAYEGHAAMILESLAGRREAVSLPMPQVRDAAGVWHVDPVPLLAALGEARAVGHDPSELAASFHESVARATADLAVRIARAEALRRVVLSGGVFQNARLLHSVGVRLHAAGLEVLVPKALGPNDGAVSFGQAAVAAATLAREG